jgi:small subunit ribosomal protein S14
MAKTSKIAKANKKPKYSSRKENRCKLCGRPKAYMRHFGLCRICFRQLANKGELPGVTKSNN